jgi:hypothetical protein
MPRSKGDDKKMQKITVIKKKASSEPLGQKSSKVV